MITTLGFFAAFLTTIAFLPQTWKVLKERDTRAISLPMYLIFTIGVALWLYYGIATQNPPVIASNSITLVLSAIILFCKIRNKD